MVEIVVLEPFVSKAQLLTKPNSKMVKTDPFIILGKSQRMQNTKTMLLHVNSTRAAVELEPLLNEIGQAAAAKFD